MKRKTCILFLYFNLITGIVISQHENHQMHKTQKDTSRETHNAESVAGDHQMGMEMQHSFSRNLPMQRNGSGTSWHPDNSPMHMNMFHKNDWMLMLHYGVFGVYSAQNFNNKSRHEERPYGLDRRGGDELNASSWLMLMANRPVGESGLFTLRGMFSLDPVTQGGAGYPLLFQSGETWKDEPLIDRQHPHDLVSELAIGYSHAFSDNTDLFGYFSFPGEPALGPPAFMHRPSALNIPSAPLSHHWQDATHIIFGVGTLGFRYKSVKLETSLFTGREPDENRYQFDTPRFDSYSFRFSVNPAKSLAMQVSYGFLKSPEVHEPETDINRLSASVLHNFPVGNKVVSSTLAWGLNNEQNPAHGHGNNSHSFVLESYLQGGRLNVFTRMELVQKSNHELEIVGDEDFTNNIGAVGFGVSKYLVKTKSVWLDLGLIGTVNFINKELKAAYGNRPLSAEVFLRLVPAKMKM